MSKPSGTNIAAGIVPFDDADTYETHDAQYGKGGWREVATTAARDAIPAPRRREGMCVYVVADGVEYVLGSDLLSWTAKPGGTGGGHTIYGPDGVALPNRLKLQIDDPDWDAIDDPAGNKTKIRKRGPKIRPEGHRWHDIPDNGVALVKIREILRAGTHWWNDHFIESPYMWFDDADNLHHAIFPAYTTNIPAALQLPDWQANHAYSTVGEKINSGGQIWKVKVAGTSNATSGPTGTADVVDPTDTLEWDYVQTYTRSVFGHATSVHPAGDWLVDDEPLFQGDTTTAFDTAGVTGGLMLKFGGTYYLYYIGLTELGMEQGLTTTCLATASSFNGPWTRHGTIVGLGRRYSNYPADDIAYHADGVIDDTAWRCMDVWGFDTIVNVNDLWYALFNCTGYSDKTGQSRDLNTACERIGYATSTDLLSWSIDDADNPVFWGIAGGEFDRIIGENGTYYDGDKWVMHFYGNNQLGGTSPIQDGICYTTADDFPHGWSQPTTSPTLICTPGGYDEVQAAKPCIYRFGGRLYHFYGAQSGTLYDQSNPSSIALAVPVGEIHKHLYVTDGLKEEVTVPDDSEITVLRLQSMSGPTSEETFDAARGVRKIGGKDIASRLMTLDPASGTFISDDTQVSVVSTGDAANVYGTLYGLRKRDGFDANSYSGHKASVSLEGVGTVGTISPLYSELWQAHPESVVTTHTGMTTRVYIKRGGTATTVRHFSPSTSVQGVFGGAYQTDAAGYPIGATEITLVGTGTILFSDYISFGTDTHWYKVVTGITASGVVVLEDPLQVEIPATATDVTFPPNGGGIDTETVYFCGTLQGATKYCMYSSSSAVSSYHAGGFAFGANVEANTYTQGGFAVSPRLDLVTYATAATIAAEHNSKLIEVGTSEGLTLPTTSGLFYHVIHNASIPLIPGGTYDKIQHHDGLWGDAGASYSFTGTGTWKAREVWGDIYWQLVGVGIHGYTDHLGTPPWGRLDGATWTGTHDFSGATVSVPSKICELYLAAINGTGYTPIAVSGCADNGAGLIRITAVAHGLSSNHWTCIRNVGGVAAANYTWQVTVIDADHFDLLGSVFSGTYTSGGTSTRATKSTGFGASYLGASPYFTISATNGSITALVAGGYKLTLAGTYIPNASRLAIYGIIKTSSGGSGVEIVSRSVSAGAAGESISVYLSRVVLLAANDVIDTIKAFNVAGGGNWTGDLTLTVEKV